VRPALPFAQTPPPVAEQLRLLALARPLLPGRAIPYFGHMRLRTGTGGELDVLLASETRTAPGLAIVDWQRAPLVEAFFSCAVGEPYEIQDGGRTLQGTLLSRSIVRFEAGELVGVCGPGSDLRRTETGEWAASDLPAHARLRPRPRSQRDRQGPSVDFALDEAQRRAVGLPAGQATLVLGEAGCGKTTVALHRLVRLRKAATGRFKACVVVPTDGLRRLTELLLSRLGVHDVEVWLYERWAGSQARRVFPDVPRREGLDASAATMRLKRHPAVRAELEILAAQPPAVPEEEDGPTLPTSAHARRHDLQRLFGDTAVLERVARAAELPVSAVAETFEHTRVQFSPTAEDEFAHVDAARLATLDGRALDDGTPMEDAATIDTEDFAVLFELDRLRALRQGLRPSEPAAFDCIVLDEAQEFSALELRLIGRSLVPGGTLIVAGDADQQIDPTACFEGWAQGMAELGAPSYHTATLEVSYRCPPKVTTLARRVLDGRTMRPPAPSPRSPLALERFDHDFHRVAWLVEALADLQERDRCTSVAVIARSPEEARRLFPLLRRGVLARLALDGRFSFLAGVNVTCVQEVKGLEFDVVIVPDASPEAYPVLPASRRALYVAVTRPTRQLVVSTVGAWAKVVPGAENL
jgi:DNA helicase IV